MTETAEATTHNARDARTQEVPLFSLATFLESLVHFIVADDQVCPINFVSFHTLTCPLVNSCR
jgi:hypothetical protein